MANIRSFKELRVWQHAMDATMRVFELTKRFPTDEKYSLTDQFRQATRSVAANISEAWRKRRYPAAFISKLNDAEGEAAPQSLRRGRSSRCAAAIWQSLRRPRSIRPMNRSWPSWYG
jgi:hypothetical protein